MTLGGDVAFDGADQIVDGFEQLALKVGVSIPRHKDGADMLSLWQLLKILQQPTEARPTDPRPLLRAGSATYELASKVFRVSPHPDFASLAPHLRLLNAGAVHMTDPPKVDAEIYNKLIELYWAVLCMEIGIPTGSRVSIDHPKISKGKNPDVMFHGPSGVHGYALKTIRALSAQTIYERIKEGVGQIEAAEPPARTGIVILNLTPRVDEDAIWPLGHTYRSADDAIREIIRVQAGLISNAHAEIPGDAWKAIFEGKKAVPAAACFTFAVVSAIHPGTGKPTAMPIRHLHIEALTPPLALDPGLSAELQLLNSALHPER